MEECQEFQKPFCGFCNNRFTSSRILQNHMKIVHHFSSAPSNGGESLNRRDFNKRYSLRVNPKKTQKSPVSNSSEKSLLDHHSGTKKNLIRCKECGKGFRYKKCLLKHHIDLHQSSQRPYEESGTGSSSFSFVTRKRSRIIRYKKTRISLFISTFPGTFSVSEIEQEVADSLILLSRSSGNCLDGLKLGDEFLDPNLDHDALSFLDCLSNKKSGNVGEFNHGFLSDKKNQLREGISVDEALKDLSGYSADKNMSEGGELNHRLVLDHEQKSLGSGDFTEEAALKRMSFLDESKHRLCDAEMVNEINPVKKPPSNESGFEVAGFVSSRPCCDEAIHEVSGLRSSNTFEPSGNNVSEEKPASTTNLVTEKPSESERSSEHRCRTCDKIFLSYQALGGHQTLHRMRNRSFSRTKADTCAEKVEVEGLNDPKEHKCIVCSRVFRSVHALGGHKKCHGAKKSSAKARDANIVMREEDPGKCDKIDLNIPATSGTEL